MIPKTGRNSSAGFSPSSESEFIYILASPALPELVKIGKTTGDPRQRTQQLSSSTSLPHPFILLHAEEVEDCDLAERKVHELLKEYRENNRREFFRIGVAEAIEMVKVVASMYRRITTQVTANTATPSPWKFAPPPPDARADLESPKPAPPLPAVGELETPIKDISQLRPRLYPYP